MLSSRVLADLDPHSVYISREEVEEANEPLEGGFFGIGIQFNILRDTLMVVDVVPGGPAEKVGMMAGDRIVAIDGQNVAGVGLTNTEVRKRLKGEKGTRVNVGVLRGNERFDFNIIRDKIPIHSVDAAYMIDKNIGYIKIARFAATTVEEFEEAVKKLQAQGMKDLIIDLQGNGGGYMGAAVGLADHLLDGRKLIVYTDGQATGRMDEYSIACRVIPKRKSGCFTGWRIRLLPVKWFLREPFRDWDRGLISGASFFREGVGTTPISSDRRLYGAFDRVSLLYTFRPLYPKTL